VKKKWAVDLSELISIHIYILPLKIFTLYIHISVFMGLKLNWFIYSTKKHNAIAWNAFSINDWNLKSCGKWSFKTTLSKIYLKLQCWQM